MIKLRKLEEADIARLIGWIPDARYLLEWGAHWPGRRSRQETGHGSSTASEGKEFFVNGR